MTLRKLLYDVDPYEGFDPRPWSKGEVHGWCANLEALLEVVRRYRPRRMAEVGSWKGLSAMYFAREMLQQWRAGEPTELERVVSAEQAAGCYGPMAPQLADQVRALDAAPPELLCVDTWLGSGEFQGRARDAERDLRRANGWPMVYFEFLANMKLAGLQRVVTPWPCPSLIAARCLRTTPGIDLFDVVYIDASHDYDDVRADIAAWWPLVRAGGLLCGDDYDPVSDPGVVQAVNEFDQRRSRKVVGRMWQIERTEAGR